MSRTRLLLLDDHTLFRAMLSRLLGTDADLEVVADCSTIQEALGALSQDSVDLVLLDFDLGKKETGFQFISQARRAGYSGRIFIVTAGMTDAEYVNAFSLGICGLFLKHSSPELLVEAIHKVMAGQTWIDQRCIQALANSISANASRPRQNELTDREKRVLKGVFTGLSNKEIGAQLNVSEASVKSALQQLFSKTGVRTRSQLVRVALEEYGETLSSLHFEP